MRSLPRRLTFSCALCFWCVFVYIFEWVRECSNKRDAFRPKRCAAHLWIKVIITHAPRRRVQRNKKPTHRRPSFIHTSRRTDGVQIYANQPRRYARDFVIDFLWVCLLRLIFCVGRPRKDRDIWCSGLVLFLLALSWIFICFYCCFYRFPLCLVKLTGPR